MVIKCIMYTFKNLYPSPSLTRHLFLFFFFGYKLDKYLHRKYFFGGESTILQPGIVEFCLL